MKNLVEMLRKRCAADSDKAAFLVKKNGDWHPVSWSEMNKRSDQIAAGLITIGLLPGDAVSIFGSPLCLSRDWRVRVISSDWQSGVIVRRRIPRGSREVIFMGRRLSLDPKPRQ